MSRRSRAVRREVDPDPRFGSTTLAKSRAETICYEALALVEERSGQSGMGIFRQAITNAQPVVEVKSRRVGGATYQVPMEVRAERKLALAIKWMIAFARQRGEKTMAGRLAGEILDASRSEGSTIKKKEETHRMAEANKAFAHYRW